MVAALDAVVMLLQLQAHVPLSTTMAAQGAEDMTGDTWGVYNEVRSADGASFWERVEKLFNKLFNPSRYQRIYGKVWIGTSM